MALGLGCGILAVSVFPLAIHSINCVFSGGDVLYAGKEIVEIKFQAVPLRELQSFLSCPVLGTKQRFNE